MIIPDYVNFSPKAAKASVPKVLREPADFCALPLSDDDREIITILVIKFCQEEPRGVGLAAPQIGYSKRICIVDVPDNAELKKWRPDLTDTMPLTILINPSYEPIGLEQTIDYEACFSIEDCAGLVPRYKSISYKAEEFDQVTGECISIEGVANGFLARVLQHEIGHLNRELFIDLVPDNELISISEYRQKRAERINAQD